MERSFRKEVELLKLGEGEVFHGEGILAVTKALLQSGVSYVGGYQGAPVSHLMDVLADARETLDALGVHFEPNASEAGAAAMLGASINYPMRGAVAFKSTVGTNVASDALSNLASAGVKGGTLLVLGEDYGEGASIIQERTHAFAMKSQIWLLDPRPNLPKIVEMVEKGFELSEASSTPVMLELRIRACHVQGAFRTKANRAPVVSKRKVLENPDFDYHRICLPPATYAQEKHKVEVRWPAAVDFIRKNQLNEFFPGEMSELGILCQGGLYNAVIRALQTLGLADAFGASRVPIYCMNVTYPLIPQEITDFCGNKAKVLIVEEGQPAYIEDAVLAALRRAGANSVKVSGKDVLPLAGEYTGEVVLTGIAKFADKENSLCSIKDLKQKASSLLAGLPQRPPGARVADSPHRVWRRRQHARRRARRWLRRTLPVHDVERRARPLVLDLRPEHLQGEYAPLGRRRPGFRRRHAFRAPRDHRGRASRPFLDRLLFRAHCEGRASCPARVGMRARRTASSTRRNAAANLR